MWIDVMQSNEDSVIFFCSLCRVFHKSMRFYSLWDFVGSLNLTCSTGIDLWLHLLPYVHFSMKIDFHVVVLLFVLFLSLSNSSLSSILRFRFLLFFIDHFVTSSMHTNMDEMDDKEVRIGLARMWLIFVLLCDSKHFTIFHFRSIDSFLVKWAAISVGCLPRAHTQPQQLATHSHIYLVQ